jgi:hypothetical protein
MARLVRLLPTIALLALNAHAAAMPPPAPSIPFEIAKRVLPVSAECANVECLLEHAYRADPKAAELALALWKESGDVAGVGPDEVMAGGFRGTIHLVPELPVQSYRKHLAWVVGATRSIDEFFRALYAGLPDPGYRFNALEFRFVRSLNKHRPSAYAIGWTVEYNVEGSLNLNQVAVRETLFHELFHLNDTAHGEWSAQHLRHDYDAILAKCGSRPSVKCLTPYAPNDTMVRGGTFYAFQQNNGDTVHEYAAELAVRYFKEQSDMLHAGKLARRAFKCGPPENARAWHALVSEFFAERDLVPPC